MTAFVEREPEFSFTDADFRKLRELVYERTGIVLRDHKRSMVYSRLARRLRRLELKSFKEYRRFLEEPGGDSEIGDLVNAITTNLTKFYREPHHFEHLEAYALKDAANRVRSGEQKRLRVWSAGCSSGEEPFTIAMTMRMALPGIEQLDAKILATDLDTNMIGRGREARYKLADVEGIPQPMRKKFVDTKSQAADGMAVMSDSLRRLIVFKQLNLLGEWPMSGPFDAIFCRNVMIYFDMPTKKRLIERFSGMLRPGGWLYVGHSETLTFARGTFENTGRTVYRRLP